jgi:hypothetical protein
MSEDNGAEAGKSRATAIGEMVEESALMETLVGAILQEMLGGPYAYLAVEGQGFGWKADTIRAIIKHNKPDDGFGPPVVLSMLGLLISRAKSSYEERSRIVHGTWLSEPETQNQSKRFRPTMSVKITVAEIEAVTDRIDQVCFLLMVFAKQLEGLQGGEMPLEIIWEEGELERFAAEVREMSKELGLGP